MDLNERRQLPLFSIGIVEKLTGLTARQIRYYEQHGLVEPARSEGKQRLFSFADVERLMDIRRLLDDGRSMSAVKERLAKMLLSGTIKSPPKSLEPSEDELYERVQRELLEQPSPLGGSMLQGELSRFYRRPR